MKNASLPEYLRRMALQVSVFGSDIRFEGISVSDKPSMILGQPAGQPSAVISQEWISAGSLTTPSPDDLQIAAFMRGQGFRKIRDSFHGWAREDGVVVMDAKPDNFILLDGGIVPIDLQIGAIAKSEIGGLEYGEGLRASPLPKSNLPRVPNEFSAEARDHRAASGKNLTYARAGFGGKGTRGEWITAVRK